MLKELFESEEIEIVTDISHSYDGNYVETEVYIDNERVYSIRNNFYLR